MLTVFMFQQNLYTPPCPTASSRPSLSLTAPTMHLGRLKWRHTLSPKACGLSSLGGVCYGTLFLSHFLLSYQGSYLVDSYILSHTASPACNPWIPHVHRMADGDYSLCCATCVSLLIVPTVAAHLLSNPLRMTHLSHA
ncbi:hypothetical protein K474DRAFT_894451 [Panus rudis PR-1116 ss-1]|nr:hypothetical protein K474DRAFT_894451 [Panus rudis PR-1116 ss-1]